MTPTARWTWALAAAALLAGASAGRADTLYIKGLAYEDVLVTGLVDGELVYESGGATRSAGYEDVGRIELDRYPDFNKAEQAMADDDPAEAARLLASLKIQQEGLATLARARQITAYDKAGQFQQAIVTYVAMIRTDQGAHMALIVPSTRPPTENHRRRAVALVRSALASTDNTVATLSLEALLRNLVGEVKPPANGDNGDDGDAAADNGTTPDRPALIGGDDPVSQLINQRKFAEALKAVDAVLEQRDTVALSRVLYQRGLAEAGLGRDMDALISFMRVVIHFPKTPWAAFSLFEAGRLLHEQGRDAQAERLWTEALQHPNYTSLSAEQQKQLDAGLEGVRRLPEE